MREINEEFNNLESILTERISDLHDVKMGQAERHAFILYRDRLWEIKKMVSDKIRDLDGKIDCLSSQLEEFNTSKDA